MASQLRFEGPVLDDLLDRVRAEVGPGARIVAANRVRKGGLGGFFSREHYEVIVEKVEADSVAPPALTRPRPEAKPDGRGGASVPSSILDLAEAVNDIERGEKKANTRPQTAAEPAAAEAEDVIDLVAEHAVTVSTESDGFASVLDRISRMADPGPAPARDPEGDVSDDGASRAAALASAIEQRLKETTEAARRSATAARVVDDAPLARPDPADVELLTETVTPVVFRRVARTADVIERPENALARLGVPARMIPRGAAPRELQGALMESLSRLPAAPMTPDANGVVVAVVGVGAAPVLLARELAAESGLDPDRVVIGTREPLGEGIPTWLQVCDAATAEERRRSWRRRAIPTYIAISVPPGGGELGWAREVIDNLEPTITWAIVDAGSKCEDIAHFAEHLGGLDALALTRTDETVSPAAVLDLGIPVGRIEDRAATPVVWADLLMQRMPR